MSGPKAKPAGATAGDPPPRVTSPPKTAGATAVQGGSLASFIGKELGVKYTGQSSGMIKKQEFDDADERAFHANKPANEAMARSFAAMVMSSAKPVGAAGMKLPSQIIKEQQKGKPTGAAAPAVDMEKKIADDKAKKDKEEREKREREAKERADKELKAKAEAPKPALSKTGSSGGSSLLAGQLKKEKEEKERKEKEAAAAAKAKADREKAEKEKKEKEEAKKKAAEGAKKPMSFATDRSKSPAAERAASPAKAATVIAKEETRSKSPASAKIAEKKPEERPKSPIKEEVHVHVEVKKVEEPKKEESSSSGGGVTKLEKDRWFVEGYDGATHSEPIIVKVDSPKESVYVGKCINGVVVQVEGKCKSLQVNGCVDVGLVCETVISTVEIMNSQKCQVQTTGIVNLIQLDNCERCKLFLSKESLEADVKLFTAKSAATLLYTPTDDGEDMLEMSLPEQFVSTMNEDGAAIRHEIVMPEAVLS